jgi:Cu(I)/Ag(I) efflux system membrane protein CusA/SilA
MVLLLRGRFRTEATNPVSRLLSAVYRPIAVLVVRFRILVVAAAAVLMIATVPTFQRLGSEFMPPLDEGAILYMPTTLPGLSVTEAARLLGEQDRLLASFPEVERVFGKAGRAETATDPAPFSMMETTVVLKPRSQWRRGLTHDALVDEMNAKLQIPGTTNAWTMPIKNRLDMLSTGIRTPVGVKIFGADIAEIERIGEKVEELVKQVPGTRSVFAERVAGGSFVDFDLNRDALARYGLTVDDANAAILAAVGGEEVTTTIEGRARYGVSVRYPRELREDLDSLGRVLVTAPGGAQIPLQQVATLKTTQGPAMVRDENGLLAGYVYVDFDTSKRDVGRYVEDAKAKVEKGLTLPPGYALAWSGQWENMLRVRERLKLVLPVTVLLIFFLLYANTKSAGKALLVMLAVPFSAIGAVALLALLGYNMSIAVWVGLIALMGLDAETGVFMLLFMDLAIADAKREGRLATKGDLVEAIVHGAVKRARPKAMTVCAAFMGLLPILWASGPGADVMKRIAAPMVGGLVTSFLLELLVYPAVYVVWKGRGVAAPQRSA